MEASVKKNILIGIAVVAGLLIVAAAGWYLSFKLQFTTYRDAQYKFSIEYPKSWKVMVHPRPNVAVVFLRPKDTALDTLQENFNVTVQDVPPDILQLNAYSATVKKQMTAVFGKSINIVQDEDVHWGWREGHKIVIEAPKPDHLKMVNVWLLKSSKAYLLTFLGNIEKYPQDSLGVNEMIRSLKLE